SVPGRLRLDEAWVHLAAAVDALDGWYARQTIEGHSYVGDGHDTIRLIYAATRELYRVRAALIGEIRVDEDERAARIDRMIAELRARRACDLPGDGAAPRDGGRHDPPSFRLAGRGRSWSPPSRRSRRTHTCEP